jgi:WD40 repeat protein
MGLVAAHFYDVWHWIFGLILSIAAIALILGVGLACVLLLLGIAAWLVRPRHVAEVAPRQVLSPDSHYRATIFKNDQVQLWGEQGLVHQWFLPGEALGLAFSPDARHLAIGTPDAILIFELASREEVLRLPTPAEWNSELQFSPDGRFLIAANDEYPPASVWDLATGERTVRG